MGLDKRQYYKINSLEEVPDWETRGSSVAIDIETTGLDPFKEELDGLAFSFGDDIGYYTNNIESCRPLLESNKRKILHNAVFDLKFLKQKGYTVNGPFHDTMLLAHVLNPDRPTKKLKDLSVQYLGEDATKKAKTIYACLEDCGLKKDSLSKAPAKLLAEYACEDVLNTFDICKVLLERINNLAEHLRKKGFTKTPIDIYLEEELPLIPVVVDMELIGTTIDLELLEEYRLEILGELYSIRERLPYDDNIKECERILTERDRAKRLAKNKTGKFKKEPKPIAFNWESAKHVQLLLFQVLGEPIKKTTHKGNPKLGADELADFAKKYDWCADLINYKMYKKLANTYIKNLVTLQNNGVIRPNFKMAGTATGRFASANPNFQNFPRKGKIKDCLKPREGYKFVYADYSQLELRIAAHLSNDADFIHAYQNNQDIHKLTASIINNVKIDRVTPEQRNAAKTVNFSIIYNAGGYRLADILGLLDGVDENDRRTIMKMVRKGDAIRDKLFGFYDGLNKYIKKCERNIYNNQFAITDFGRFRFLEGLNAPERKIRNHWLKAGFNMLIQSFGASMTRRSMIKLYEQNYKIVSQIHDCIILEVPVDQLDKAVYDIKKTMESVTTLKVPVIAEPKVLNSFNEEDVYEYQATKETKATA